MSRITGPKCKLCRRAQTKLFLKGDKCFSDKCVFNMKTNYPGKSTFFSSRLSNYGIQLREKQKIKCIYGLNEAQMKKLFGIALKLGGDKGLNMLQLLEMRLDSIVYMLGIAPSRPSARQMVSHGKIAVNGKKLDIPSYTTKVDDKITVLDAKYILISASGLKVPTWLKKSSRGGSVMNMPSRDMIDEGIKENLIIEFYSR
ncbi:MAG: 30S ribosomal protein S4 [Patescibacteria group bacterium]|nr:30S ribosomal protein S4 [Patescibacteria group bacterium]